MSMPAMVGARNSSAIERAKFRHAAALRTRRPSAACGRRPVMSVAAVRIKLLLGRATGSGPSISGDPRLATAELALSVLGFGLSQMHRLLFISVQSRPSGLGLCHDGSAFAVELPVCGDSNVSGRFAGLSKLAVQFLYQARRLKIVSPNTLTRICIQIASVVSIRTK